MKRFKINYAEIENVRNGKFDYRGETWRMADYSKNSGFSPVGLWNDMTNGKIIVRVYKKDVAKVNPTKAVLLFN